MVIHMRTTVPNRSGNAQSERSLEGGRGGDEQHGLCREGDGAESSGSDQQSDKTGDTGELTRRLRGRQAPRPTIRRQFVL